MGLHVAVVVAVLAWAGCANAVAQTPRATPAQRTLAREIYAELIGIDTTPTGNTFTAAQAVAKRLRDAGYPAADVQTFEPKPGRGNLVARLRGSGKRKPLLVMAHLDVVPAKREDWATNPFELVEKDGYFYGRGTTDDKFRASALVAALIRYKQERYRPDRDIILVLQTDEEIGDENTVGITWLLAKHRDLLDAELALNENGWLASRRGKPLYNGIQIAEKGVQIFTFEVRNRGGHASQPRKDNAIYELSEALLRVRAYEFPVEMSESMRRYFEVVAAVEAQPTAAAIKAFLANPSDATAAARVAEHPFYGAMLRTTCVATRFDAGFADGALAPLARATLRCGIMPGQRSEEVQQTLERLAGKDVTITPTVHDPPSITSVMNPDVVAAVEKLTRAYWPGTAVVQTMSPGGSDSLFLRHAGIPSFGHSGMESDLDDFRMHGKDERVRVEAFHTAHQYLYDLVKLIAGGS